MCWKWVKILFGIYDDEEEEADITKKEKIDGETVENLLEKYDCEVLLSDEYYLKYTKKALKEFLEENDVDKEVYKKVIADCDDFSFKLMGDASFGELEGSAFGILWAGLPNGGGHAVNIFIDDELNIWVIEPQTDELWLADDLVDEGWDFWIIIM